MTLAVLQSVYKKDDPQFLFLSLESLANQTHPADSIVLVKDGTLTPEIEAVIANWKTKLPLNIVGYEKNRGLAYALNYGLQFVNTDLVARMDSDDISLPERFEKQVRAFESDNTIQVLGTGICEFYVNSDGIKFENERFYSKVTKKNSTNLYYGTPLAHPTVMMKTSLLKKFRYNEKNEFNEDIELWFRFLAAGIEIRTLHEVLLNFRITNKTLKRRSISKAFVELYIYYKYLFSFNGFNKKTFLLFLRFVSRFLPSRLNRKLYFSKTRKKLFIKSLR